MTVHQTTLSASSGPDLQPIAEGKGSRALGPVAQVWERTGLGGGGRIYEAVEVWR